MTLAELAAAAGLGKSTLAQLESGKANPSVETLWAIAAALEVPFARIVEEERPSLRVVRAADVPPHALRRDARLGRPAADRARTAAARFDLYALDLEAGRRPPRRRPPRRRASSTSWSSSAGCAPARRASRSRSSAGDLVTFGADVPHVYEALETDALRAADGVPVVVE